MVLRWDATSFLVFRMASEVTNNRSVLYDFLSLLCCKIGAGTTQKEGLFSSYIF